MFVSGTDCHGTPITERAKREKKSPKDIADYYDKRDRETLENLIFLMTYIQIQTQTFINKKLWKCLKKCMIMDIYMKK